MGYGLVIGFIAHFYTQRLVPSVTAFTALLDNVFQQWMFLCFQAYVLTDWWSSHINCRLNSPVMRDGPHHIASAWTAQKMLLPTVTPLLRVTQPFLAMAVSLDPQFLL
jgi:hypothetical protein